jgi:predicted transcriptional regulator of viral defense system
MNRQKSTANSVLRRIRGHGRGWIFTTSEFLDIGTENSLKKALSRLQREGSIRRIARGIYDYPRLHKKLGVLSPNPDDVAAALAASTGSRIQISGGRAANLFGLTTQVPAQLVYLTDGPPRKVKIAGQTIQLKNARPSKFPGSGTTAGLAIQAMRAVGPKVDKELLFKRLSHGLSASDKLQLIKLRKHAPRWTQEIIHQLEMTIHG